MHETEPVVDVKEPDTTRSIELSESGLAIQEFKSGDDVKPVIKRYLDNRRSQVTQRTLDDEVTDVKMSDLVGKAGRLFGRLDRCSCPPDRPSTGSCLQAQSRGHQTRWMERRAAKTQESRPTHNAGRGE